MGYTQVPLAQVSVAGIGFNGPEGVAFDLDGNLYGGGQDGVIYRLRPGAGRAEAFATVGGRPAGLAFDRHGMLFVCEPLSGRVLRVDRAGNVSVFAEYAGTYRIRIPNFCTFDAGGDLWVSNSTDRPVPGWTVEEREDPQPNGGLVRLRPDGTGELVARGLYLANGTAIDPSEEYVYVLQSTRNDCVRVPIDASGIVEAEPYGPNLEAMPDGMAFDADGNLIITLPHDDRLVVLGADGTLTTLLHDPEGTAIHEPTNCAFGGAGFDTLHVAHLHADHVAALALGRRGHPLYSHR